MSHHNRAGPRAKIDELFGPGSSSDASLSAAEDAIEMDMSPKAVHALLHPSEDETPGATAAANKVKPKQHAQAVGAPPAVPAPSQRKAPAAAASAAPSKDSQRKSHKKKQTEKEHGRAKSYSEKHPRTAERDRQEPKQGKLACSKPPQAPCTSARSTSDERDTSPPRPRTPRYLAEKIPASGGAEHLAPPPAKRQRDSSPVSRASRSAAPVGPPSKPQVLAAPEVHVLEDSPPPAAQRARPRINPPDVGMQPAGQAPAAAAHYKVDLSYLTGHLKATFRAELDKAMGPLTKLVQESVAERQTSATNRHTELLAGIKEIHDVHQEQRAFTTLTSQYLTDSVEWCTKNLATKTDVHAAMSAHRRAEITARRNETRLRLPREEVPLENFAPEHAPPARPLFRERNPVHPADFMPHPRPRKLN